MSNTVVAYIHGKGGTPSESKHYEPLFPQAEVLGLAVADESPWQAGQAIHRDMEQLRAGYERIILIANSIGAYYAMHAGIDSLISHAFFISPITDMKMLIRKMMANAGVSEEQLKEEGVIHTGFGEDLSWEYLSYVRRNPIVWNAATDILYGSRDTFTTLETVTAFAERHCASLTVMEEGEHWFHTDAQMRFLDEWIKEKADRCSRCF